MSRIHDASAARAAELARWFDGAHAEPEVRAAPEDAASPAEVRMAAPARSAPRPSPSVTPRVHPHARAALDVAAERALADASADPAVRAMMSEVQELLALADEVATFRRFWLLA